MSVSTMLSDPSLPSTPSSGETVRPILPPPNLPPSDMDTSLREHTAEVQARMRLSAREDSSSTDIDYEDPVEMVERREIFTRALSRLSDSLLQKAYVTKVASNNTILHRISLAQANIEALERRYGLFRTMEEEAEAELAMSKVELQLIQNVLRKRGICEDDIDCRAIYADDLVALTIGDTQPSHRVLNNATSNNSNVESVEGLEDDLVYKDAK